MESLLRNVAGHWKDGLLEKNERKHVRCKRAKFLNKNTDFSLRKSLIFQITSETTKLITSRISLCLLAKSPQQERGKLINHTERDQPDK
jgi:hypothetical protein